MSSTATLRCTRAGAELRLQFTLQPERLADALQFVEARPYDDAAIDACRQAIEATLSDDRPQGGERGLLERLRFQGRSLARHLVGPETRQHLLRGDFQHLLLVIDEQLAGLPWELIHLDDDGAGEAAGPAEGFLALRFAVSRAVLTTQVPRGVAPRETQSPMPVLLVGDPQGEEAREDAEQEGGPGNVLRLPLS